MLSIKIDRARILCLLLLVCIASLHSQAQTVTTVATFNGTEGAKPLFGPLVQAVNENLYGTAFSGGTGGNYGGTIFEIDQSGGLRTLYNFCTLANCADGEAPYAGLTRAGDGKFYGTTGYGGVSSDCPNSTVVGCGTVFEITEAGKLTTLYNFCSQSNCSDGELPQGGLVLASNGKLYGTSGGGIAAPDGTQGGTIFTITPAGSLTTLYRFCTVISGNSCADGESPNATLIQGSNGNLYGTTVLGGAHTAGTVFEISPTGTLVTLHSFCAQINSAGHCADGESPVGGLILGANGKLYGTITFGGRTGHGAIFEITPGVGLTTLYSFCSKAKCADGSTPEAALLYASDGNLYGTTYQGGAGSNCTVNGKTVAAGCGTIFEITPAGTLTTLYSFCSQTDCADGKYPYGKLVEVGNGLLYGTTSAGGDFSGNPHGWGTVFSLAVGLDPVR
jgi:uncharacterized repeat protein (TIGR03803 family)